ncbi:MAG: LPS export ABC transporter periplasmic protein LptC [candidate division NC10 bacterium]|nr:LPS export ABC transporter periplasmic protein LptC [candidate division NC10 bacterium]
MRSSFSNLAVMSALVGMGVVGLSLLAGAEGHSRPGIVASPSSSPDAAIDRIRMTESRMGEPLWEVEADKGEIFEDRGIVILTRVVHPVRIVIHNGKESLTTLAEKAVVDLTTKDLQLFGHVRSESSKGMKFSAEHLTWSAGKRQISTDAPVVIKKAGLEIRGKGMVADTILERMTIRKPVTTLITLSRKQEPGR